MSQRTNDERMVLDWASIEEDRPGLRDQYLTERPFPHIVLDDFLKSDVAARATAEFGPVDSQHWISYVHVNENKYSNPDVRTWGPTLQSVVGELNSPRFVRFLCEITGIDGLIADDDMEGGGLHQSLTGGFLNIHADFTVHPLKPTWQRRVNLLLYFNDEWPVEYGGELEFWSADMKRREASIAPLGNRAVIFSTDRDSFHGHPEPLRNPHGTARRSLAIYYFTIEDRPEVRSTEYRSRPGEGARSVLIYLDKRALRIYDRIKRRLGVSDQRIHEVVRRFRRHRGPRKK